MPDSTEHAKRVEVIEEVWKNLSIWPTTKTPCSCDRGITTGGAECLVCLADRLALLTTPELARQFILLVREARQLELAVQQAPVEETKWGESGRAVKRRDAIDLIWRMVSEPPSPRDCSCGRGRAWETLTDEPRCPGCLLDEAVRLTALDHELIEKFIDAAKGAKAVEWAVRVFDPANVSSDDGEAIEDDYEPGICVACKAATAAVFAMPPTGVWKIPVCLECRGDGSFDKFLEKEIEGFMAGEEKA